MVMRTFPFSFTFGPELKQTIRAARQDPRRRAGCPSCGATMAIAPDRAEQRVRCPGCWRWQTVAPVEEAPWRLSPDAAEALRRTRRWLRG